MAEYEFPYTFGATEGVDFDELNLKYNDLIIYYGSLTDPDFIDCKCSRWDTEGYSIVVETWLTPSQLQTLRNNITPGAVDELYTVLGRPLYYDKTWEGKNTLYISANRTPLSPASYGSKLYKMRRPTHMYVSNITTSPIKGASKFIDVKIEGYISGSTIW